MVTISIIKHTPGVVVISSLEKKLQEILSVHNVVGPAELSVVLVDRAEMLEYVHIHLKETGAEAAAHPVLSFVQTEMEGEFQFPPDGVKHLGEIIVSVDHAKEDALKNNISLTDAVIALADHALLHLLGIHHD